MSKDLVPSITAQGLEVHFVRTPLRTYNSGLLCQKAESGKLKAESLVLCSRRWNPETKRSELWWQTHDKAWPVGVPTRGGFEHIEDGRVIRHNGRLYLAYTDGDYRRDPYVSRQGFCRLRADLTVEQTFKIDYGSNYREVDPRGSERRSEKNWQFFSHDGRVHFVHSISPHVVVALNQYGKVADEWRTQPPIAWPWGSLSGGTPPVRVERLELGAESPDCYVSFFHSYLPEAPRHRRYSMAAYAFAARPPFDILAISEPLLIASAEDETLPHPGHPEWDPIVIFPCGAVRIQNPEGWIVSAGVNDSYDAIIRIPDTAIRWRVIGEWARSRPHYFHAQNGACPVAVPVWSAQGVLGQTWVRWTPVGEPLCGARGGVAMVSDGASILRLRAARGVREIEENEYRKLRAES